jgi:hypothetical protein
MFTPWVALNDHCLKCGDIVDSRVICQGCVCGFFFDWSDGVLDEEDTLCEYNGFYDCLHPSYVGDFGLCGVDIDECPRLPVFYDWLYSDCYKKVLKCGDIFDYAG